MVPEDPNVSGTLHASLNYLANIPLWAEEKPWETFMDPLAEGLESRTNVQFKTVDNIPMYDVRDLPNEAKPKLGREGFEHIEHPFPDLTLPDIENIDNDANKREVMKQYLAIMTAAFRNHFKGAKAICYDWRVSHTVCFTLQF